MESLTTAQQELYDWLVEYINTAQHAPSIRQMMKAMNLKSPAPIQSRLERLRSKGYIDWTEGKARTLRILHKEPQGIKVLGAIAAGGLVEPFTENQEYLEIDAFIQQPNCFALRVTGDSMIEDLITEGDVVIMRKLSPNETPRNGSIVAARVEGYGTTLKRFYQHGEIVILQPANAKYRPIEVNARAVQVQGLLSAVWRDYQSMN
ncbi:MAG: transcriptional repressor LexA [Jaaginema sp. PMC 1079.18]|nr:transcriptional repressor LexA [Jaaginema sp. PMC 1080.18]MEC4849553.1 transcriptional repressor LexA [Jaaginema sp. PMC 1079.18]MEC4867907.1 transcriptional repressor LexA [Jaaginema sp. PMC 1078.18]